MPEHTYTFVVCNDCGACAPTIEEIVHCDAER
jgi:hypothetical protein